MDEFSLNPASNRLIHFLLPFISFDNSNHGESRRTRDRSIDNQIHGGSKQIRVGEVYASGEGNLPKDGRQPGEWISKAAEYYALRLRQGPRVQMSKD